MEKPKDKELFELEIGDSAIVKSGVKDPDTGGDLGGWQGLVTDFGKDEDGATVCIEWDSITLKGMPRSAIEYSEREGLDWRCIYLYVDEVEKAEARDSRRDVEKAVAEIQKHTCWFYLDEEGARIQEVLDGIDPDDTTGQLDAWEEYLDEKLKFPFEAEISEWQERGPLRAGDRLTVKNISGADETYGIIVAVRRGRERFDFPLCDLEVRDKKSANYQPIRDYVVWFANK